MPYRLIVVGFQCRDVMNYPLYLRRQIQNRPSKVHDRLDLMALFREVRRHRVM